MKHNDEPTGRSELIDPTGTSQTAIQPATPTHSQPEVTPLNLGGCPECCTWDSALPVGSTEWVVCHRHKTRWCWATGGGTWDLPPEVEARNEAIVSTYRDVEPAYSPSAAPLSDIYCLTSSVVCYDDYVPYGPTKYRRHPNGQLVRDLICRYHARRVADPMEGSGTTRDAVARLNAQREANIQYWGGDLQTGFNLLVQDLPGSYDFVWLHPPYWNMIRRGEHPDDLSGIPDYHTFRLALKLCLLRCVAALEPGGRLAVLIGDFRRQGTYIPIVRDLLAMERDLGRLRSIIIKVQETSLPGTKKHGLMEDVPIRHEYCVVFQKSRYAKSPQGSKEGGKQ